MRLSWSLRVESRSNRCLVTLQSRNWTLLIADEGGSLHTGDSDMKEGGLWVPQGAGILRLLSHIGYTM